VLSVLLRYTDSDWRAISVRFGSSYILTDKLASLILTTMTVDVVKTKMRNERERQSMPRPKKPFNQQKGPRCRRYGHRQNHSRDNAQQKEWNALSAQTWLASLILTTILSRIISSWRSLYPQCSDNVQSEVTKFSTFSLSSCFRLLNFTLSNIYTCSY
jgi:hypothetical protein